MTNKLEIYKCRICGNTTEIIIGGAGTLVCCGEEMEKIPTKNLDEGFMEHMPIIKEDDNGEISIKVGENIHPMTKEHYIQFVEIITDDNKCVKRKFFEPEDEPLIKFQCGKKKNFGARAYCNIHGLWGNWRKNNG